jgi:hypothetical protein
MKKVQHKDFKNFGIYLMMETFAEYVKVGSDKVIEKTYTFKF